VTENNDASAPDATPTTVNEPVQLADQQPAFAAAPATAAAAPAPEAKASHTRTILEVVGGVVAVGLIAVAGVTGFALGHLTSDKDGRGDRDGHSMAMPGDRQEFLMPDQDDQRGPGMQGDQRGPGMQGDQRGPGLPGDQGGPGLQGGPGMVPGQNLEDLLQGLQEMLGAEGLQGLQDMLGSEGLGSLPTAPSAPAAPQG
jgi:hypothetical protein